MSGIIDALKSQQTAAEQRIDALTALVESLFRTPLEAANDRLRLALAAAEARLSAHLADAVAIVDEGRILLADVCAAFDVEVFGETDALASPEPLAAIVATPQTPDEQGEGVTCSNCNATIAANEDYPDPETVLCHDCGRARELAEAQAADAEAAAYRREEEMAAKPALSRLADDAGFLYDEQAVAANVAHEARAWPEAPLPPVGGLTAAEVAAAAANGPVEPPKKPARRKRGKR